MGIKIYKCDPHLNRYDVSDVLDIDQVDINQYICDAQSMVDLALKLKNQYGLDYIQMPVTHYPEVFCLGTQVEVDFKQGQKICKERYETIEEAMSFTAEDIDDQYLKPVLQAVKILKDAGEFVIVDVTGPITLLSNLLPLEKCFKAMRKNKEEINYLLGILEEFVASYEKQLVELGADLIYYVDNNGTMDLVGPKFFKETTGPSYLRPIAALSDEKEARFYLCPKSLTSLMNAELIKRDDSGIIAAGTCIAKPVKGIHYSRFAIV